MPDSRIVQFRSRVIEIDDACAARAAEAGVTPIEQRLWEAGFTREGAAKAAATEVTDAVDKPSPA
jgi:hypothetical protein